MMKPGLLTRLPKPLSLDLALGLGLGLGLLITGCSGSKKKDDPPPPTGVKGTFSISGTVTYDFVPAFYVPSTGAGGLNFAQAVQKPVRNGKVAAYEGNRELASTTTDQSGRYSLTFTAGGSAPVEIAAVAMTSSPAIQVQDNTDGNAVWSIGAAFTSGTSVDLHATHGWTGTSYHAAARAAAPFAVLDSMYTSARAFLAVRPNAVFPTLAVNWSPKNVPQAGNKALGQIGTSHYTSKENQIYILGKEGADTDEFDTHVIVHEWAHYFESNLSRSDSPGGPHTRGDVLDPRLSFGEGYGNGLAAMLLPETVYADTSWTGGTIRAFGFDAETEPNPTDDPTPGVFSESTVMRLLYDIFDGGSGEGFDGLQVGLGTIYDVLAGPQKNTRALTTIGSFVAGLKAQPGVNVAALDSLMAQYQIGPITSEWGEGDANLSAMYTPVASLPYTSSGLFFGGGFEANKWQQNQYFVVTGNGGQITIRTTCAQDVDILVYRSGAVVGQAATHSGNETFQGNSQAGAVYVMVITGYGATPGDYPVQVDITTP